MTWKDQSVLLLELMSELAIAPEIWYSLSLDILSLVPGLFASPCCKRFEDLEAVMLAKKPVFWGDDGVNQRWPSCLLESSACWSRDNASRSGDEGMREACWN